MLLHRRIGS